MSSEHSFASRAPPGLPQGSPGASRGSFQEPPGSLCELLGASRGASKGSKQEPPRASGASGGLKGTLWETLGGSGRLQEALGGSGRLWEAREALLKGI